MSQHVTVLKVLETLTLVASISTVEQAEEGTHQRNPLAIHGHLPSVNFMFGGEE